MHNGNSGRMGKQDMEKDMTDMQPMMDMMSEMQAMMEEMQSSGDMAKMPEMMSKMSEMMSMMGRMMGGEPKVDKDDYMKMPDDEKDKADEKEVMGKH